MATRQYVQIQREALKSSLRAACRENRLRPGDAAPSLRQLGEEFSLSQGVIVTALRELVEEGFLHTVERKGTFVGPPRPKERPLYVLVNEPTVARYVQLRGGFEERIASLGGSVMTVEYEQARQLLRDNNFPDCAGVFELAICIEDAVRELHEAEGLEVRQPKVDARVYFGDEMQDGARCDAVSFDDNSGGRLATEHLTALGHERIAFLGMHQNPQSCLSQSCVPDWSCWREQGWQKAMCDALLPSENLAFYARTRWDFHNAALLENECVTEFLSFFTRTLKSEKISAAVVVNDELAACLLERLRKTDIERSLWPAVVSFDGAAQVQNDVVTSLRLPWEKLGRSAAELLWERSHGILKGAPIHRAVPMRLIPRLSCRTDWNALAMAS